MVAKGGADGRPTSLPQVRSSALFGSENFTHSHIFLKSNQYWQYYQWK